MEIIPAIYILNGRCVALYKGSYEQKTIYVKSPFEMANFFQKEGAKKLHLIDLDGCRNGHFIQHEVIKKIIKTVRIPVQIEAGFSAIQEIAEAFALGAAKVALRPTAIPLLSEALTRYGSEKIIVEIQAKGSGVVGAEKSASGEPADVVSFAEKLVSIGVKEIIYKDERSEGTLIHPNYDEVDRLFLITGQHLCIYVSGGIAEIKHLKLLKKIGASGAIIGKAFYEKLITVRQAEAAVKD